MLSPNQKNCVALLIFIVWVVGVYEVFSHLDRNTAIIVGWALAIVIGFKAIDRYL